MTNKGFTTIEQVKASTSIPRSIKVSLDTLEYQDEWPPNLTRWMRGAFVLGRELKIPKEMVVKYVRAYARDRNYSSKQIDKSLRYIE